MASRTEQSVALPQSDAREPSLLWYSIRSRRRGAGSRNDDSVCADPRVARAQIARTTSAAVAAPAARRRVRRRTRSRFPSRTSCRTGRSRVSCALSSCLAGFGTPDAWRDRARPGAGQTRPVIAHQRRRQTIQTASRTIGFGHLALALRPVDEDDRDLGDPEAPLPGPEAHLDLKRVAVRADRVEIDGLEHGAAEAFEPAGRVEKLQAR